MLIQANLSILMVVLFIGVTLGYDWEEHKAKYGLKFYSFSESNNRKIIFTQNLNDINEHNIKASAKGSTMSYLKAPNRFTHLTYREFISKNTGYVRNPVKSSIIGRVNREKRQVGVSTTPKGCTCTCPSTPLSTATQFKKPVTTSAKPIATTTKPKATTTKLVTTKLTTTAMKKHSTTLAISTNASTVDWRNSKLVGPIKDQGPCGLVERYFPKNAEIHIPLEKSHISLLRNMFLR
jgi:hypothetical protein